MQRESPRNNVEAFKDLVRDNTGPLTELYNLDKGCLAVALCDMSNKRND